jgi:hypothetical protein
VLTDCPADSGALSRHDVTASFLQEKIVNSTNYPDKLDLFAVPQMAALQRNVFFQQDDASLHWVLAVRQSLNKLSKQMDRGGRINPLVSSLTQYNPTGLFLLGLCEGPDIPSKS